LIMVFAAAGLMSRIPLAALGGVLVVTAIRMVHLATVRTILRSTRADAVAFALTALVTVSFDLIIAVVIGVAVAVFFAIRALVRSAGVEREDLPGEERIAGDERIAVLRFDGPLIFSVADRVLAQAQDL